METIDNNNIDNSILLCGLTDWHSLFLELLFESKTRCNGGEISQIHFDKQLSQYLITYKNQESNSNCLSFYLFVRKELINIKYLKLPKMLQK
jgi:hypothetical protein